MFCLWEAFILINLFCCGVFLATGTVVEEFSLSHALRATHEKQSVQTENSYSSEF